MKMHHVLLAVSAGLLVSNVFAGTMGPVAKDRSWVLSVSGGPEWARAGDTQSFFLNPDIIKTYAATRSTNVLASGEVFLGVQRLINQFQGQFGLAVATTSNAKMQGQIWDDADPQFNNLNYKYGVRNSRVAVKGKLLVDKGYWAMPWISGSAGVGFNRANSFDNTPVIFEALPNPNFASHTKTAFTYTLGVGVQRALSQNWQVGIGYEFADWGKSQLSRAPDQTLNSGLTMNHLYTNGVLFNFTYVS